MLKEKKAAPAIQILRHRELAQKIAALTKDIAELKSEKALLTNQFDCADDCGMANIKQRVASMTSSLEKLKRQEAKCIDELEAVLAQYDELQQQTADMDAMELNAARQAIRPDRERETIRLLQTTYGKRFDSKMLTQSQKEVTEMLDGTMESVSIRQKLHEKGELDQVHQLIQKRINFSERQDTVQ